MSPNRSEKNLDGAKEGDKASSTTQQVAAESVADEPQAQPKTKFTTYSGTDDKTLHAVHSAPHESGKAPGSKVSEFVLEDKAKGLEHTSRGERKKDAPTQESPSPRESFLIGLKAIFDHAKSPEEAEELQSAFSIEYMVRKTKQWMGAVQEAFTGGAGNVNSDKKGDQKGVSDGTNPREPQPKVRYEDADETVRHLRADPSREVVALADEEGIQQLLHKVNSWQGEKQDVSLAPPILTAQAIDCAAATIHDALHATDVLGIPQADVRTVLNTLGTMNEGDRALLTAAYQRNYQVDVRAEAAVRLQGEDEILVVSALGHQDGGADDLATINASLERLRALPQYGAMPGPYLESQEGAALFEATVTAPIRRFAEKELRETFGSLVPEAMKALLEGESGKALLQELLTSEYMSPQTKESLAIYIRSGARPTDEDVRQLAAIAIKHHDQDIFEEAFINASPEMRAEFGTLEMKQSIRKEFGDNAQFAIDHVETGGVRTSTLVRGDTHWWESNKESIQFALEEHATPAERDAYRKVLQYYTAVNNGMEAPLPAADDVHTHTDMYAALMVAAGSPRELEMWQAQLSRGNDSLIVQLASQHDDGVPFLFGTRIHFQKEHDINKMFQTVNNMSERDWNELRTDPTYRYQLYTALKTFLKDDGPGSEFENVQALIETKLTARTYEESKRDTPDSLGIKYEKPAVGETQKHGSDLPPETSPIDVIKAFMNGTHNVSAETVKELLSNPNNDVGDLKNDYAQQCNRDLSADVLSKVEPHDRLEFLRLLSAEDRGARQEFYDIRRETREQYNVLGDGMMNAWSNSSQKQSFYDGNKLFGVIQKNADHIEALSPDEFREFEDSLSDVDKSEDYYISSKRQFSEEFVNKSLGLVAVGGSFYTGGGSWQLYCALMATGGAYKVGTKAIIEGPSYRGDPIHLMRDATTGGVITFTGFLSPGAMDAVFQVGKVAAGTTARTLLAGEGRLILKETTEKELAVSLEEIASKVLTHAGRDADQLAKNEIATLAKKIAQPGHEAHAALLIEDILNKNVLAGAENYVKRGMVEYAKVATVGGGAGGANAAAQALFDDPDHLAQRTFSGVTDGAGAAVALQGVLHVGGLGISLVQHVVPALKPRSNLDNFRESLQSRLMADLSEDSVVGRVGSNPLLHDPDFQLGSDELAVGQTVKFQNASWEIVEQSGPIKVKKISRADYDREELLNEFKVTSKDLKPGNVIVNNKGETFVIQAIDGHQPNQLYRIAAAEAQVKILNLSDLISSEVVAQRHMDLEAAKLRLLDDHNDAAVKSLKQLDVAFGSEDRMLLPDNTSAEWYRKSIIDPHDGKNTNVLFRVCKTERDFVRMEAEVKAQWLMHELGLGDGVSPTAIRKIMIEGRMRFGFIQETSGNSFDQALPALVGEKFYGMKNMTPDQIKSFYLSSEEVELLLRPNRNASELARRLESKSLAAPKDAGLSAAARRLSALADDPVRLQALKRDGQLAAFRIQMEELVVMRHMLGDADDHAKNYVLINESGHIRLRNIDLDPILKMRRGPEFNLRHDINLMKDIAPLIANSNLSNVTIARIDAFLGSKDTVPRLKSLGFSDAEISSTLDRARYYVTTRRLPPAPKRNK